jgi:hypothetical protein
VSATNFRAPVEAGPAFSPPLPSFPHIEDSRYFPFKRGPFAVLNLINHKHHFTKMVAQPELHADIYPAVDPKNFVGSQKGNVALVIGKVFAAIALIY